MSRSLDAIDSELAWVQEQAGAPRSTRLGCSTISHDRLGFCNGCSQERDPGRHGSGLEVLAWRLLALREADEARSGATPRP